MLCQSAAGADAMAGPDIGPGNTGASEEASEVRELFRMCCWAAGRGGFQYCTEYGICTTDATATCTGRGAAAGLVLDCGLGPTRTSGVRYFLLPSRSLAGSRPAGRKRIE
jgi:hypothetical protein